MECLVPGSASIWQELWWSHSQRLGHLQGAALSLNKCLISLQNWLLAQLMPVGIYRAGTALSQSKGPSGLWALPLPNAYSWHLCSPPCLENELEILHIVIDPATQCSLELLLVGNLSPKRVGGNARSHSPELVWLPGSVLW